MVRRLTSTLKLFWPYRSVRRQTSFCGSRFLPSMIWEGWLLCKDMAFVDCFDQIQRRELC